MKIRKFIAKLRSLLSQIAQPTVPQSLDLSGRQLSALPPQVAWRIGRAAVPLRTLK